MKNIFTEEILSQIESFIGANKEEMVSFLEKLVNFEGKHGEKEKLILTANYLKNAFCEIGLDTQLIEVGENNAPIVTGIMNADAPGKPILFTGHYDTVFGAGSRGKNPFYVKDGKAYGPGVCDMKGGITIAYFVAKALKTIGFTEAPVRLFFVGDEEVNHQGGNAIDRIKEYTRDALVVFNMENRYESGQLCVGRKGNFEYRVITHGLAAHPGHNFDDGRNAIEEMAHKVIALQKPLRTITGQRIWFDKLRFVD